MTQIPVSANHTVDMKEAIRRARQDSSDLPIYQQTVAETQIDPERTIMVRKPTAREQKDGRGLTALVYASLSPDGSYDPERFVPFHICNTSELPTVKPKPDGDHKPEGTPADNDAA